MAAHETSVPKGMPVKIRIRSGKLLQRIPKDALEEFRAPYFFSSPATPKAVDAAWLQLWCIDPTVREIPLEADAGTDKVTLLLPSYSGRGEQPAAVAAGGGGLSTATGDPDPGAPPVLPHAAGGSREG